MKPLTIPAWALPSYRNWHRWGWPGQAGCCLLVLAGLGWGVALPWLQGQVDAGARAAAAARRQALGGARVLTAEPAASASPASFLSALPDAQARPQRVAALLKLAAQHRLTVQRSEFQAGGDAGAGFGHYRVTLPVAAAYPDLCAFIAAALAADDAMALDALRLSREQPGAPQLLAELRFTLFDRLPGQAPDAAADRHASGTEAGLAPTADRRPMP